MIHDTPAYLTEIEESVLCKWLNANMYAPSVHKSWDSLRTSRPYKKITNFPTAQWIDATKQDIDHKNTYHWIIDAKVSSNSVINEYSTQYVSHCWSSMGDFVSIAFTEAYL